MKFTVAKKAIALTGAVAMLGSVAACGSDTASGKPAQDKDVTEITVWAWEPTLTQVAKDFTKKTGIKVDLKNVGTNTKEYTQLDNAIEAGSGAPDVAQVEYYAIPQYAIKGNLLDITDKTSGYSDFYTPWPVGFRAVRRQGLRPADGFRPNGLLLQQGGLRQGRC